MYAVAFILGYVRNVGGWGTINKFEDDGSAHVSGRGGVCLLINRSVLDYFGRDIENTYHERHDDLIKIIH